MRTTSKLLTISLLATSALAQPGTPTAFSTPQQAVDTMVQALQSNDTSSLQKLLGSDMQTLISSGDPVADKNERDAFLDKYKAKHQIVAGPDNTKILEVGTDNWPSPIPLRQGTSGWYFDAAAGKQALLYRRVGRNELDVMKVCKTLVDAEQEYAKTAHDGRPAGTYASHFWSGPGRQNGLYWQVAPGDPPSPAGPLVAVASAQGYEPATWNPSQSRPFFGYFYKILTAQGPSAPGGARNYFSNGALTNGFAILAYPAQYKSSGVVTFMVDMHGNVYEKDLGDNTAKIGPTVTTFDPDKSWSREGAPEK